MNQDSDEASAKPLNELPFSGEAVHRLKLADAQNQISRVFVIHSSAGTNVKFGEILKRHFERKKERPAGALSGSGENRRARTRRGLGK
jgi:hypothetical protein